MLICLYSFTSFAQDLPGTEKECRIAGGTGFAGPTKNTHSLGMDFWLQLDYTILRNVSIATEFENMSYKQPGYYKDLPVDPNVIKVFNNNFSLMLKYHLPIKSAFKVALGSGWTYATRQNDYYIYETGGTEQGWYKNVTSFSDYRIPILLEIDYPVSNTIDIRARAKYNLNAQNGDTYSTGIGVSLKL